MYLHLIVFKLKEFKNVNDMKLNLFIEHVDGLNSNNAVFTLCEVVSIRTISFF